jgi:hypothetical protein
LVTGRIVKLKEARGANTLDAVKRLVARSGEPVIRQAVRQELCDRIRRRTQAPWDGRDRRSPPAPDLRTLMREELRAALQEMAPPPWDGRDRRANGTPLIEALLKAVRDELRAGAPRTESLDARAVAQELARHLNRAPAAAEAPRGVEEPEPERISLDDVQSMVDALLKNQR